MRFDNLVSRVLNRVTNRLDRIFLAPDKRRRRAFQRVYRGQQWGADGASEFYSGHGSRGEIASVYVEKMGCLLNEIARELGRAPRVVDLGCGDFAVGSALLASSSVADYVGCDIVPELIERNNKEFGSPNVSFRSLDIVTDDLPDADVCLVRQVLQHLSNDDILRIIKRLNYSYVFVTEGHPVTREGPPNPDKVAGASVRFNWQTGIGRGVELDLPPFNIRTEEQFRVARADRDPGFVVTERVWPTG